MRYGSHEINDAYVVRSVLPRIRAKVHRSEQTGCDVWQGALADGYGTLSVATTSAQATVKVHRFLLICKMGPLAPGIEAEHKCRNRACVRIHKDHVRPLSGVENIRIGMAHHPEVVAARVRARKERGGYATEEGVKDKISKALKGRRLSEEAKAKMSATRKGSSLSQETREKISRSHMGITHTEEAKRKMSESQKGRKHSEETRQKMRDAHRRRLQGA